MSLTDKDVQHIARLAALKIDESEVSHYATELNNILSYVEKLAEVDTTGVEPTCHVHGVVNAFRSDVVKPSLEMEQIKKIAPDFCPDGFRVPRVIG